MLGKHTLSLDSKFQINSLQDVFCHPFYWQIYGWIPHAPQLVVDLGAHCGHFSMLADTCFRVQFPKAETEYILVEPNPKLVRVARRNLKRSGLCPCHLVHQGLVGGSRNGSAMLWVSKKNYLNASLDRGANTNGVAAQFFDLEMLVKGRPIDLLKVDIEGAEFDFVEQYPELLNRVQALMIEIHQAPESKQKRLHLQLAEAGLRLQSAPIEHNGYSLARFQRRQEV